MINLKKKKTPQTINENENPMDDHFEMVRGNTLSTVCLNQVLGYKSEVASWRQVSPTYCSAKNNKQPINEGPISHV
jgi:hypothetical protein